MWVEGLQPKELRAHRRIDRLNYAYECCVWYIVFPDAQYGPSRAGKCSGLDFVAFHVPEQLRSPIPDVHARLTAMSRATMPKATINEYGDSLSCEGDIRPDKPAIYTNRKILSESIAKPVQYRAELDFWLRTCAADGSHVSGSA